MKRNKNRKVLVTICWVICSVISWWNILRPGLNTTYEQSVVFDMVKTFFIEISFLLLSSTS